MNSSPAQATSELAEMILAMPPARRGAVMQSVVSFRPDASFEDSFGVGPIRAAFANFWETRFRRPVPIEGFRAVLEPPVPIATVLVFSKLMLMSDAGEVDAALHELTDYLHARTLELTGTTQRELFPGDTTAPEPLESIPPGESVTSLSELISERRKFPTVYADPPWAYDNEASRAAAVNHYPTMSVEDICAEPVGELAADDAHLHLWTTNAFLRESFDVIEAWGFRFKSCLVWVKTDIGMGNYWRVSHEFLLLGVRGSLRFRDRALPSWLQAPRSVHSRKPGVIRTLIERASPPPYLELYGREELPNSAWTVYGNQVEPRLF